MDLKKLEHSQQKKKPNYGKIEKTRDNKSLLGF